MSQCICSEIPDYETLGNRQMLNFYLDLVYRLAREKVLEITNDTGDNVDYADIEFFCKCCGRKLKLVCEAYHGAGGYIGLQKYEKKRPKRKKHRK